MSALVFSPGPVEATPVCTLSGQASSPLEVLPAGCELTLANGPVVFSGMSGNGENNTHTVTVNQFVVTRSRPCGVGRAFLCRFIRLPRGSLKPSNFSFLATRAGWTTY
jgi:hypothetical protein